MNWDESELKQMLLNKEMRVKGISLQAAYKNLSESEQWGEFFKDPVKEAKADKPKGSKHHNEKTSVDGMVFDSKKESQVYNDLKLRLRAKDIKTFARQVPFILNEAEHGNKPVIWIADFIVWELDGRVRIMDVKPSEFYKTDTYKVKKRLFESQSGLKIEEIY